MKTSLDSITEEKIQELSNIKDRVLTTPELVYILSKRKLVWFNEHKKDLLDKYKDLTPEEKAYRIVFLDYMGIDEKHLNIQRISKNKIRILSKNPCPFLEACYEVGLPTDYVCKHINEAPIQELVSQIHPKLQFSRNYDNIRPNHNHCEEFIEYLG